MDSRNVISIWFFIALDLLVSGLLITGAGIYELFVPPEHPVALFHLHANIWWGALLLFIGIFYTYRFAPHRVRAKKPEAPSVEATTWRS
jgi:hypothetical protein